MIIREISGSARSMGLLGRVARGWPIRIAPVAEMSLAVRYPVQRWRPLAIWVAEIAATEAWPRTRLNQDLAIRSPWRNPRQAMNSAKAELNPTLDSFRNPSNTRRPLDQRAMVFARRKDSVHQQGP